MRNTTPPDTRAGHRVVTCNARRYSRRAHNRWWCRPSSQVEVRKRRNHACSNTQQPNSTTGPSQQVCQSVLRGNESSKLNDAVQRTSQPFPRKLVQLTDCQSTQHGSRVKVTGMTLTQRVAIGGSQLGACCRWVCRHAHCFATK